MIISIIILISMDIIKKMKIGKKMKIVLLDALTFGETDLSAFDSLGDVEVYKTTSADEVEKRVIDADVVVTNKVVITTAVSY